VILGIDLNSRSVAISYLHADGRFHGFQSFTTKYKDRAQILGALHDWMRYQVTSGDVVYVESPVLAGVRNIQSTIKVAAAYGSVLAAVDLRHAECVEVPVSSWKLATVGRGNASKDDVSKWLHAQHPDVHTECSGDQNLMDAHCIALYGYQDWSKQLSERHLLHQAPPAAPAGHGRRRN
jgi:Holliday junction resolvasome RuvABC endonuclease subunit